MMRILKKAQQKNIEVNTDFYSINEVNKLLDRKLIFYLDNEFNVCYNNVTDIDFLEHIYTFRISINKLKELKVVLENGYYTTIAITNDDEKIYVKVI